MLMIGRLNQFGFMSSSIFEKIVSTVAKIVAILEYAISVFFREDNKKEGD